MTRAIDKRTRAFFATESRDGATGVPEVVLRDHYGIVLIATGYDGREQAQSFADEHGLPITWPTGQGE